MLQYDCMHTMGSANTCYALPPQASTHPASASDAGVRGGGADATPVAGFVDSTLGCLHSSAGRAWLTPACRLGCWCTRSTSLHTLFSLPLEVHGTAINARLTPRTMGLLAARRRPWIVSSARLVLQTKGASLGSLPQPVSVLLVRRPASFAASKPHWRPACCTVAAAWHPHVMCRLQDGDFESAAAGVARAAMPLRLAPSGLQPHLGCAWSRCAAASAASKASSSTPRPARHLKPPILQPSIPPAPSSSAPLPRGPWAADESFRAPFHLYGNPGGRRRAQGVPRYQSKD